MSTDKDKNPWGLGPRELQVMVLRSEGYTNKEIASLLHLSDSTVGTHLSRACSKIGGRHRYHALTLFIHRKMGADSEYESWGKKL